MVLQMRKLLWLLVALNIASPNVLLAQSADEFPSRTIKMVAPFAAGGQSDLLARTIGNELSSALKQSVVVENKTGAAGLLGARSVVDAAPDGHTLLMGTRSTVCMSPLLFKNPRIEPLEELTHLAITNTNPFFLFVRASGDVRSVEELIKKARSKTLTYASVGVGSPHHVIMEMFAKKAQLQLTHVPYRGVPNGIVDLLAGNIDVMFIEPSSALTYFKAGQLIPLAVASAQRSSFLPDVPTLAEVGVKGVEYVAWNVVSAPAGLKSDVAERLNKVLNSITGSPAYASMCSNVGCEPAKARTLAEVKEFVRTEISQCQRLVQEIGLTVQE